VKIFKNATGILNVLNRELISEQSEDSRFVPLDPVHFFSLELDCHYLPSKTTELSAKVFQLPDTSPLCREASFAKVSLAWSHDGITIALKSSLSTTSAVFPTVSQGDSLELFFDTRDLKSAGFNHRFCHHFYFLPEEDEGVQAGEITRFRTEDSHELCDSSLLKVRTQKAARGYAMHVFIPKECLHGYDPDQFDRLGFTYRINRSSAPAQHFSVTSNNYAIDQQPSLWSSLRLIK
jgi:hypothetical protein